MRIHVQGKEEQLEYVCCVLNAGNVAREIMRLSDIPEAPEDREYSFLVTCHPERENASVVLLRGHHQEFRGTLGSLLTEKQAGGRGVLVGRVLSTCFVVPYPATLPEKYTPKLPKQALEALQCHVEVLKAYMGQTN